MQVRGIYKICTFNITLKFTFNVNKKLRCSRKPHNVPCHLNNFS